MSWKQSRLIGIVLVLLSQMSYAQQFIGIHCGSDESFESPQGEVYYADVSYSAATGYGFIGGATPESYRYELVGGREDVEPLYRRVREGEFSYRIDLSNGLYAVKLMLGDLIMHGPGFRSMAIVAEGETIVQDLDLCEEVGHAFAWSVRFVVDITDDQLTIDFSSEYGGATCSAIAVRAIDEDSSPPSALTGFETIGGYEMNILFWDFCPETDFAGYRVYRRTNGGEWEQITEDSYPLYRYLDYDVTIGMAYDYRVTAVDFWGNESEPTQTLSAAAIANLLKAFS